MVLGQAQKGLEGDSSTAGEIELDWRKQVSPFSRQQLCIQELIGKMRYSDQMKLRITKWMMLYL